MPEGESAELLLARFRAQRGAMASSDLFSLQQRRNTLDSCIALLKENHQAIAAAIESDFGSRPRAMTLMYDLLGSINSLHQTRSHMKRWLRPQKRRAPFPANLSGARVRVEYQPKGVVGILGTWNFPVFTLFSPLAQVVAAGNRALLKPSDVVPQTAELLCRLAPDYLDPEVVAIVDGDREVARTFSALPFDHLVLTGGTEVGRAVMGAAAPNLTPLTLELGGKSPVVIGRSARLEDAVEKILFAKVVNTGQMCVSPDYVLLPRDRLEAFLVSCRTIYPATFSDSPEEAGSIINDQHYRRVQSCLADARQRGTRLINLGEERDYGFHCMPLHLAIDPAADSLLGCQEVFGPVLNVLTYGTIEDAIATVNAGEKPLALYYFGSDAAEQRQVLDRTRSGGVTINNIAQHPAAEDAPFGGIGASGMGHYHGREGCLEFSHARTVFTQGWFDVNALFGTRPPFGEKLLKQLESSLRR